MSFSFWDILAQHLQKFISVQKPILIMPDTTAHWGSRLPTNFWPDVCLSAGRGGHHPASLGVMCGQHVESHSDCWLSRLILVGTDAINWPKITPSNYMNDLIRLSFGKLRHSLLWFCIIMFSSYSSCLALQPKRAFASSMDLFQPSLVGWPLLIMRPQVVTSLTC